MRMCLSHPDQEHGYLLEAQTGFESETFRDFDTQSPARTFALTNKVS